MQLSYLWPVPCVFSSWVSSGRNVEVTVEVGILFFQPVFPQGSLGLGQLCKVGTWWLQRPVLTDMEDSSSVHMTLRRMDILLLFEMVYIPCVLSHSVVCNSLWSCNPPWGFSRQEGWGGLPCPPPKDLSNPGLPQCRWIAYHLSPQGSLSIYLCICA